MEHLLKSIIGDTASGNSRVERLARWYGATIIDRRDGPEWMKVRGWQEIDWALTPDAWVASSGRRRQLVLAGVFAALLVDELAFFLLRVVPFYRAG